MNFVLIFSLYTSKRLPFSPCIYEGPFFACPFSICITHPQTPKTTVVQGGDSLEISVRDAQKIVEVWLTNAEKNDPTVAARLTPLYRAYQKQKYTVAVFQSGGADLLGCTRDLLRYNRKRVAELETLREKSANPAAPEP